MQQRQPVNFRPGTAPKQADAMVISAAVNPRPSDARPLSPYSKGQAYLSSKAQQKRRASGKRGSNQMQFKVLSPTNPGLQARSFAQHRPSQLVNVGQGGRRAQSPATNSR